MRKKMDEQQLQRLFDAVAPAVDFCSLRVVDRHDEVITVKQGVVEPTRLALEKGAMITVVDKGGLGYAATSELSEAGLRRAVQTARE